MIVWCEENDNPPPICHQHIVLYICSTNTVLDFIEWIVWWSEYTVCYTRSYKAFALWTGFPYYWHIVNGLDGVLTKSSILLSGLAKLWHGTAFFFDIGNLMNWWLIEQVLFCCLNVTVLVRSIQNSLTFLGLPVVASAFDPCPKFCWLVLVS